MAGGDPEFDADVGADPGTSDACADEANTTLGTQRAPAATNRPMTDLARGLENGYFE